MPRRSNINIIIRLSGLVRPLAGYMMLAIIMGLAGHLCATFITVSGAYGILTVLKGGAAASLKYIFIGLTVMGIMRGLLRYGEQTCNHYIAFKLLALIRDKVFKALRRLTPAKLEGKDKGNLISVITSDIELLEVFYAHTISPAAIAVLFTAIKTFIIGRYSLILGATALTAYITVGLIIPVITSKAGSDQGLLYRQKTGELSTFVLDSLRGLKEIIQFGAGHERIEEMNRRSDALAGDEEKMKMRAGKNMAATGFVITVSDVIMLMVSGLLYMKGQIAFEGVVISTVGLVSSFGPVIALANLGSTLENTFAAGNRVLDILDESPVTEEVTGGEDISFSGGSMKNVDFSYGNEEVLKDFSIDFPEGKIIGINGPSGCGKSTALKLIMRFWTADSGKVEISDKDVNNINTESLRDIQSYVTQEIYLFRDSIANNMKVAKPEATDEEIKDACQKASVHDFIMSLPKGYETEVGELGDTLSCGEKQRLGVARAFLHDSDLMLLDEPTSNLDSLNEAIILKSLDEARGRKTVVLVSHRKSTMRIADKVFEVKKGA